MTERGLENSGGPQHIYMVKEAVKRVLDEFDTMNRLLLQFEMTQMPRVSFHQDRYDKNSMSQRIDFRPDIMLSHIPRDQRKAAQKGLSELRRYSNELEEKGWESIQDSNCIIIEVEMNPMRAFKQNVLKHAYYSRLKDERHRSNARFRYAFVLVAPTGVKVPEDIEPYDELWTIPKSKLEEVK